MTATTRKWVQYGSEPSCVCFYEQVETLERLKTISKVVCKFVMGAITNSPDDSWHGSRETDWLYLTKDWDFHNTVLMRHRVPEHQAIRYIASLSDAETLW